MFVISWTFSEKQSMGSLFYWIEESQIDFFALSWDYAPLIAFTAIEWSWGY